MVEDGYFHIMTKDKEQNNSKAYQCQECGLFYKDKEISEKCEAWCKEHKSCNLEIIKHSIKHMTNNNSQKGFAMPAIIAIVAVVLVLGGVAFYANRSQVEKAKMAEEKAMMEKKAMEQKEKNAMMKDEGTMADKMKDEKMMGTGVILKNGKIMLEEGGTMSPLTKEYVFETGVKVSLTGKVTKKDGTTVQLKEGESAWADGTIMKAGADTMMKKDEGAMMKKEEGAMMAKYTGTVLAGKSAPLLDYNKADYDAAIASDKLVVLYFYANWCPICKEETKNALYPAFNELTTDKVVGIRINYKDSDTDKDEENLARQYGIPYQHTKVLVKNGRQILKAPDGWDKARYLAEINKALAQ